MQMKLIAQISTGTMGLAVLLLVGCSPGAPGSESARDAASYAGKAVDEAGQALNEQADAAAGKVQTAASKLDNKIDRATGSVQQGIADATISSKVLALLIGDPLVQGKLIDVKSKAGVVSLEGVVENNRARYRAVEDARAVEGVVEVVDQLTVKQ